MTADPAFLAIYPYLTQPHRRSHLRTLDDHPGTNLLYAHIVVPVDVRSAFGYHRAVGVRRAGHLPTLPGTLAGRPPGILPPGADRLPNRPSQAMQAALLTLAAATALTAPVPKAKGKVLYFPTTVGAESVFVETDRGVKSERTQTVTKVEYEKGAYQVTLQLAYDKKVVGGVVYAVSESGLSHQLDGPGRDPPVQWLKVTAKPGDSWECKFDGGVELVTFTHVGEEEVEVPAGKFKALRVDSYRVTAKFRQKIRTSVWVAPEVGTVKGFSHSGGGPDDNIVCELKSFTPGKGEKKAEQKKDK